MPGFNRPLLEPVHAADLLERNLGSVDQLQQIRLPNALPLVVQHAVPSDESPLLRVRVILGHADALSGSASHLVGGQATEPSMGVLRKARPHTLRQAV